MEKIPEIDLCKGVAIILVILGHSFILYPINLMAVEWCKYTNSILSSFHLATFFFISGFLFTFSIKKSYGKILKSKCMRLLIPYIAFAIVNLMIKICFPTLMNRKIDDIGEYVEKLLLYGGELWFVYSLFTMFFIWGFILKYFNRRAVVIIILLLYVLDSICPRMGSDIFLNGKFVHYSIFFLLGYFIGPKYLHYISRSVLFTSLMLFILFSIALLYFEFPMCIYNIYTFIGIIFCLAICYAIKSGVLHNVLSYFGKYSLQFYIFNGFMLVPTRFVLCNLLHIDNSFVIVLGVFIACIFGEFLIIEFLKRIKLARYVFSIPT